MRLPDNSVIAREKITDYLLVRQSRNDKADFLSKGGFTAANPDVLIESLVGLREQHEATPVDDNRFGFYYEVVGILRGPTGAALRVRTIWMTEHLSGTTKFITLIPIGTLDP